MSTARRGPGGRFGRSVPILLASLLPVLALLVVAELVLWAAGLGAPERRLPLQRGFDSHARYIVPDETSGGWRTQMFDGTEDEVVVPPRDARRRVLLLGGSNTQGFPQELLDKLLTEEQPEPGWEVINLGRAGYGSERVSILLEDALVLDPDVVLIYAGHNEFVEGGFALELQEEWSQPWLRDVADALRHLRLVNVLSDALRPSPAEDRPEPRRSAPEPAFRELRFDQTLLFYEAYRENLRAMCHASIEHGAAVVLSTVIGNDLAPPMVSSDPADLDPEQARRALLLADRARKLTPPRFVAGLLPPVRPRAQDWGMGLFWDEAASLLASSPARGRSVPPLRPLLGAASAIPPVRADGLDFVAGTGTTLPELWADVVYDVLETISAIHARQLSAEEREQLVQARVLYEQSLEIAPEVPMRLFALALTVYLLGDDDGARELFARAASFDRAPHRGNDHINGALRQVAAEFEQVQLVDAERLFRGRCPGGIISYEVLADGCHLHPGMRAVLMGDFVPAVLAAASPPAR